jgi:hypothetical protein
MTFQEQKDYILVIVKKHFPQRIYDMEIINMEEEVDNVSLFSGLRNQGIQSLDA